MSVRLLLRWTAVGLAMASVPAPAQTLPSLAPPRLDLARSLGAQQLAFGWVQKVSNLILNVNLVIEDAGTGQVLHAESVDIRGNTDESWSRGLRYLVDERMFPD